MCDWFISDCIGEQLSKVGPKRVKAEVSWAAHKETVWPVPSVSSTGLDVVYSF